ncbi:MAG: hypothetical protein LC713_08020, partial [Actinobacteria bacterium]|nr:hypothetical protein [Actinomycetota bacterium]
MAVLQAQRTLVKSPPELWAEVSNPESLAKRLSDFGEIRITRLVPEQTVAWEGARASGTVELEASGWGTKVRLTASPNEATPRVAARERIVTALIDDATAGTAGETVVAEAVDEPPGAGAAVREPPGAEAAACEKTWAKPAPAETPAAEAQPRPAVRPARATNESPTPDPTDAAGDPGPPPAGEETPRAASEDTPRAATASAAGARSVARMARRCAAAAAAATEPPAPTPAAAPPAPPKPARRGFFARLFGRRSKAAAAPSAVVAPASPPAPRATADAPAGFAARQPSGPKP